MELKIRGVDPVCVRKIDELARAKGLSRSAYLKALIEAAAVIPLFEDEVSRYHELCDHLVAVIGKNNALLSLLCEKLLGGDFAGEDSENLPPVV